MNTFRHSGKLGDIIYSLPSVQALGGGIFYVDPVTRYFEKPSLGMRTAEMMVELLETQDYVQRASLFRGEPVQYDLDRFRERAVPVHLFNGFQAETDKLIGMLFGDSATKLRQQIMPKLEVNIPQFHWESVGLPGKANLDVSWLRRIPQKSIADIVICKTARGSGTLDWALLKAYEKRMVFVGLEDEWQAFRRAYFNVEFYKASTLLDLAQVISGTKLYVGNQSFGLALADSMLIPRVAELSGHNPIRMSTVRGHQALTPHLMEAYIN